MIGGLLWFLLGAGLYVLGYLAGRKALDDDRDGAWLAPERRRWRG